MIKIIIVGFVCLSFLSGCSTLNPIITDNVNSITGEPGLYYESNEDSDEPSRAQMIGESTVRDLMLTFHQDPYYRSKYPDSTFDATLNLTSTGAARIDLTWSSPIATYPPGEYNIGSKKVQLLNGREGLQIVDLAARAILKVQDQLKADGKEDLCYVVAQFAGQADGVPILGHLIYRGEWQTVVMKESETVLNGIPYSFNIVPGQRITNEELAALRAYCLKEYLIGSDLRIKNIQHRFEVNVVKEQGRNYRWAKISIYILNY